jgi:hypothetical protein
MPIYEYIAATAAAGSASSFAPLPPAATPLLRCPRCEGANLRRLVSKVAVLKSEESRLDNMADPSFMAGLENEDPRALAGLMRKMSEEMGEPLDPKCTRWSSGSNAAKAPNPSKVDAGNGRRRPWGGMGGGFDDDF